MKRKRFLAYAPFFCVSGPDVTDIASFVTIVTAFSAILVYLCVSIRILNIMKSSSDISNPLVDRAYRKYRESVYRYILRKLECEADSEDLTQDTFLRLLDYDRMLREDTVCHFIFTVARNLVNDWLRRRYKREEITSCLMEGISVSVCDTESKVVAGDLARLEMRRVERLPARCRAVYALHRFEEMTADEIAARMNLSKRTVEGHILLGRRQVREFMKQCI